MDKDFGCETRAEEWKYFSELVENHIAKYTIKQYGDAGNDTATEFSYGDCMENIRRYINRYKTNQRKDQNLLDLMKIAHYCAIGYFKFLNEQENTFTESDSYDILKENKKKIRDTLCLFNSMIESGEMHSETSKNMFYDALDLFKEKEKNE